MPQIHTMWHCWHKQLFLHESFRNAVCLLTRTPLPLLHPRTPDKNKPASISRILLKNMERSVHTRKLTKKPFYLSKKFYVPKKFAFPKGRSTSLDAFEPSTLAINPNNLMMMAINPNNLKKNIGWQIIAKCVPGWIRTINLSGNSRMR